MGINVAPNKILLLDRDGVINKKADENDYIKSWEAFDWIKDNVDGLIQLSEKGFQFIVLTNQAGVARGKMTRTDLEHIHQKMVEHLSSINVKVLDVFACMHNRHEGCDCRKPMPGLFMQAAKAYGFDLEKTLYIGDDPKDCKAACAAGSNSIFLGSPQRLDDLTLHEKPIKVANSIKEVLPFLETYFKQAKATNQSEKLF
ncbi:MAG: HAD-IIIA family hydrolase [Gammaproteobacteria bacterium]|nr:HAD-IIIA family hydrolase [Gammaproteobacteria bacterium]